VSEESHSFLWLWLGCVFLFSFFIGGSRYCTSVIVVVLPSESRIHTMASFQLVLGPPPASVTETKVLLLAPLNLVTERTDACPFGREAIRRAGGKVNGAASGKKGAGGFPDHLINIPDGINPDNLKDFTFYDILGFTPEWADSADHEAIRRAYHKAVLKYHPDKAQ
jgi:hypothetical protein